MYTEKSNFSSKQGVLFTIYCSKSPFYHRPQRCWAFESSSKDTLLHQPDSFFHHTERKRSASYRNEMKMLHIVEWNETMLHLKRRFYEALCILHALVVSSTQKYEAALRAVKRTFGAWNEAFSGFIHHFCGAKMVGDEGLEPPTFTV